MREKKIGILTFHNSRNYGAVLQAYALQKKLSEYFDVVEVIDYRNAEIEKSLHLCLGKVQNFSAFFRYVLAFIFRMHKKVAFDRFLHKHVKRSQKVGRVDFMLLSDVYDIYICGSDQVWNTGLTGEDESYFLDFAGDDKCKAAYAASFGDTQIEITAEMQKWLQRFGLITLREEGRRQELEALINRPVKVCCDPTILLTQNTWGRIASGRLCHKPYVFLMIIEESGKVQEYAEKLAREKNLILVSNKNCMRFFLHLTPADFLSWVCHAQYVVTNSFHGTVFSLIFEKQFVSCRYSAQGKLKTRITELLEQMGLGHRVTDNVGLDVDEKVPWENVRDTLKQMRKYSWDIFYSWLSELAGGVINLGNRIKVLQSVNSFGIGGNEIFVLNFFRHIDKERFQVDFVIYDDSKKNFYDEVVRAGSKVYICRKQFRNKYLQLLSQMLQVRRILKDKSYDIIHCHSCSFIGILRGAVPGYFTRRTKVISHAHNLGAPKNTMLDNFVRQILKGILSHISDLGFACSEACGESKYTRKFRESKKYSVINNAIEMDRYGFDKGLRQEKRKQLGIGNQFVVGSVGRLEKQKNFLFMIDVMEKYLRQNEECCLLLVGDGSQKKLIMDKAKAAGIEGHLHMIGATKHPEEYYSAMDVFVLPSIYEGFGIVNIEAQASGLPCVVSDAVPKAVDISGRVAFLRHDIPKWCEELERVREGIGSRDRKTGYSDRYDIKKEVLRLEKYYTNLL